MEYLLRGKIPNGKKWFSVHLFEDNNLIEIWANIVAPSSVGMWSGLTTTGENPARVFEGDIIKSGDHIGIVRLGRYKQVPGGKENIGFYVEFISGDDEASVRNDLIYWIEQAGARVIGNTTDNPELEVNDNG